MLWALTAVKQLNTLPDSALFLEHGAAKMKLYLLFRDTWLYKLSQNYWSVGGIPEGLLLKKALLRNCRDDNISSGAIWLPLNRNIWWTTQKEGWYRAVGYSTSRSFRLCVRKRSHWAKLGELGRPRRLAFWGSSTKQWELFEFLNVILNALMLSASFM